MLKHKKISEFFLRFLVILVIHYLIKAGDYSFGDFSDFTLRGLVFSIYFVVYWLIIWYVAVYINTKMFGNTNRSNKLQIVLLFAFNIIFGFTASILNNLIYRWGDIYIYNNWNLWKDVTFLNPELTMSLLMIYILIFSISMYVNFSFKQNEDLLKMEKLQKDNTIAKYLNLKAQVEPHFLFNSLSVLSSLIHSNPNLADEFTLRLSKILRYMVQENEMLLVPLKNELGLLENYLFLMKVRFGNNIYFTNELDKNLVNTCFVPPSTLQSLVENAIKHNKFNKEEPLNIKLNKNDDYLIMSNNLNLRRHNSETTKMGLENLKARYSHFTAISVIIKKTENEFIVSLPMLNKEPYERFNI
jgi:hypothetical protein